MSDFFNYSFYNLDVFNFTIGNILIVLLIIVVTKLLLRIYRIFVHKRIRALDVFDYEKEQIFLKVGRSIIIVLSIVVSIWSLGLSDLVALIFGFELVRAYDISITLGKIMLIILVIIVTRVLSRLVRILLKKNFSRKTWIDEGKEYTVYKLTKYALYGVGLLIALNSIGINMKLILAGAGALLVGLGFGLQYLFYDIISGLIILFEGPVKVGDVIEVEGLVARVQQIDIRTSKVMTRDGKYIIIPNSKLTGERVVNWTHGATLTRFNIKIGVGFKSDTALVKDILYNCALRHPDVSKNREIIVRFENFGESTLDFVVFFWAKKTWVVETLQSEIRFDINRQFRKHGIDISYPQRDLHFKTTSPDFHFPNGPKEPEKPQE
ncbi:mechanosensitive ion channel [Cryomorpha ignava]|uniref:Mechanosensitive ion channel n=1 Tax=Cryomorpha ignava TaxID=101383 RepID=A0A7K3WVS5_9FLAO|nr:mechanosensitive ion channel domain-containing protein [Cryomorpha ignava]NEN25770.1 mechanosensitive ion channel [Cryomorpha ignava]